MDNDNDSHSDRRKLNIQYSSPPSRALPPVDDGAIDETMRIDPSSNSKHDTDKVAAKSDAVAAREHGGPSGPEPTRYGDWERNGRCTDF